VNALRKKYKLPGMSVLQFGFDEYEDNPHKPQNINSDSVVYTGTHDNDTTKGWFNDCDEDVKKHILQTLNIHDTDRHAGQLLESSADLVVDKLIDSAMNSQASLCMIPMQDCLHLGSEARMNTPGTVEGNWQWSFEWEQIYDEMAADLRMRIEMAKRRIE
jgi:4-alpha-glucanotransferase